MNSIKVIGIDLAKSVFQVCVWMSDGSNALIWPWLSTCGRGQSLAGRCPRG